jgi:hypothetical protein
MTPARRRLKSAGYGCGVEAKLEESAMPKQRTAVLSGVVTAMRRPLPQDESGRPPFGQSTSGTVTLGD